MYLDYETRNFYLEASHTANTTKKLLNSYLVCNQRKHMYSMFATHKNHNKRKIPNNEFLLRSYLIMQDGCMEVCIGVLKGKF